MPRPQGRPLIGWVTALLVALSGTLVVLSSVPASASTAASTAQVSARSVATGSTADQKRKRAAAKKKAERAAAKKKAQRAAAKKKAERAAAKKKAERAAAKKKAERAAAKKKAERAAAWKKLTPKQKKAARKAAAKRAAAKKAAQKAAAKKAAAKRRAAKRRAARLARVKPNDPSTWIRYAPDHYTPPAGAKFNNPYAGRKKRRALLTHVIRSIDSSPGYRRPLDKKTHRPVPCPSKPRYYPSAIRIAVYSVVDREFADAIVAAQQRCVSVKILMNSHLSATTSHPWAIIVGALGVRGDHYRHRRSFARRCSNGCLGTSVLHAKFYLFSHAGKARDVVMTGSSNISGNAVSVQWNDLFTVRNYPKLYDQFRHHFGLMVPDRRGDGPYITNAGRYQTTFYPFREATRKTDRTMVALRSVRCAGADGGSGIKGHSVIYIAAHSWFGKRGRYLAAEVRDMYRRGCYVRIIYSMMSRGVYTQLTSGTGPRMRASRVLFPGPRGVVAHKYSHLKMFAVSGHVGSDHSSWYVWTGSNNWTDRGLHADEVTLRIRSHSTYKRYVRHWKFIKHRRSSPVWAKYAEPTGGGRAP